MKAISLLLAIWTLNAQAEIPIEVPDAQDPIVFTAVKYCEGKVHDAAGKVRLTIEYNPSGSDRIWYTTSSGISLPANNLANGEFETLRRHFQALSADCTATIRVDRKGAVLNIKFGAGCDPLASSAEESPQDPLI